MTTTSIETAETLKGELDSTVLYLCLIVANINVLQRQKCFQIVCMIMYLYLKQIRNASFQLLNTSTQNFSLVSSPPYNIDFDIIAIHKAADSSANTWDGISNSYVYQLVVSCLSCSAPVPCIFVSSHCCCS